MPAGAKPAATVWGPHGVRGNLFSRSPATLPAPREHGIKGNSVALTINPPRNPFAVSKAIAVLHGHDGDNSARSLDVLRDVENATRRIFPRSQLSPSFHEASNGTTGPNCSLIHVDAVQAQFLRLPSTASRRCEGVASWSIDRAGGSSLP